MGAGIAAILTYILREYEEFSSCTCIAFAPGMCLLTSEHYVTFLLVMGILISDFNCVTICFRPLYMLMHWVILSIPTGCDWIEHDLVIRTSTMFPIDS